MEYFILILSIIPTIGLLFIVCAFYLQNRQAEKDYLALIEKSKNPLYSVREDFKKEKIKKKYM